MRQKRRLVTLHAQHHAADPELCTCIPFFLPDDALFTAQKEGAGDYDQWVLAPSDLHKNLHTALQALLPCSQPLSILLLHVSQIEQVYLSATSTTSFKRQRYHA